MDSFKRVWLAPIVAIAGLACINVAPASAAGGCSVAAAAVMSSGQTATSNPASDCPSSQAEFWAIDVQTGDTLSISADPMPSGGGPDYMDLNVYGPNVQTIGQPICNLDINSTPFVVTCVIPAAGRYLLVNDAGAGQFTPTVSSAPASASTVVGSCAPGSAPTAAGGATQYVNSQLCQGQSGPQFWAMNLRTGNTLTVNGDPIPSSGGRIYMDLDIYGPNAQTIGQPLCNLDINSSPFTETCVIPATGRYLLVIDAGSGSFTPAVGGAPATQKTVAGSCTPESAPAAALGVTEYTNSQLCRATSGPEYWAVKLKIGDTLTVSGDPIPSSGGRTYMDLDTYGPNVQTIGHALCRSDINSSPFRARCVIPATGRYLLVSDAGSGRFTPTVTHPLLTALRRALVHWSPTGRHATLHIHVASPARAVVCVVVVRGRRAPSAARFDCAHASFPAGERSLALAYGRRVFAHAGSARITARFTQRARRLLADGHRHEVTLITIYAVRGQAPTSFSETIGLRAR